MLLLKPHSQLVCVETIQPQRTGFRATMLLWMSNSGPNDLLQAEAIMAVIILNIWTPLS